MSAGPWTRLLALGALGGTALAVISGVEGWNTAHRVLAAVALPPLIALVILAWLRVRRLLPAAVASIVLFGLAAGLTSHDLHLALAALAFAAAATLCVQAFRGEAQAPSTVRDYVTLTKPRVMSLLLLTGGAAIVVGAGGRPSVVTFVVTMAGLALACGGAATLTTTTSTVTSTR